jgi:hypothetical protein
MNQRIQQLAEQADVFEYKTYYDPTFSKSVINDDKVKKFAELIVMECLTICEELGDKGMDGHYCADKINKTFRS